MAPIPVASKHYKAPARPTIEEKATAIAKAHFIAFVIQLPYVWSWVMFSLANKNE